jgi:hypothetical protein
MRTFHEASRKDVVYVSAIDSICLSCVYCAELARYILTQKPLPQSSSLLEISLSGAHSAGAAGLFRPIPKSQLRALKKLPSCVSGSARLSPSSDLPWLLTSNTRAYGGREPTRA